MFTLLFAAISSALDFLKKCFGTRDTVATRSVPLRGSVWPSSGCVLEIHVMTPACRTKRNLNATSHTLSRSGNDHIGTPVSDGSHC
jgi:hypothetical protein